MTIQDRAFILAGNYELLDWYVADYRRKVLLAEKKYDEMLERKNAEIAELKRRLEA